MRLEGWVLGDRDIRRWADVEDHLVGDEAVEESGVPDRGDPVADPVRLEDVQRGDDARRRTHLAGVDLEAEAEAARRLAEGQEVLDRSGPLDAGQAQSDDRRVGVLDKRERGRRLLRPEVADRVDDDVDGRAGARGGEARPDRLPHRPRLHPVADEDHRGDDDLRVRDPLRRLPMGELGRHERQVVRGPDEGIGREVRGEEALEVRVAPRIPPVTQDERGVGIRAMPAGEGDGGRLRDRTVQVDVEFGLRDRRDVEIGRVHREASCGRCGAGGQRGRRGRRASRDPTDPPRLLRPSRSSAYHAAMPSLADLPQIRLTELTDCGGCAAKLGADLLADALSGLGAEAAPGELIAGLNPPDDAAAYRVAPDLAVIGTLDFFPPLVDDAATYGAIAAANALSDVFAMGGRVLFALSIAAFPEDLPRDTLAAIFEAASAKVREAGGTLAGGHTIRDPEPKYGLAVIGAGHPDRLFRKGGARPGDVLVLTKRLGTGFLVSGRRQGRTSDAQLAAAVAQMMTLNRAAAEVFVEHGIRGATDVTGFGLLGHGLEMARASGTRFTFSAAALPALDGALELARAGIETGGAAHNRRFVAPALTVADGVDDALVALAHDPQTSGGLLAAVAPDGLAAVEAALDRRGVPHWRVGTVDAGDPAVMLGA